MPVPLKDLVESADRMQTTAGSLALQGLRPAADATLVARLRAAGAVILGKTDLSERAGGMSLVHHAGWSARGGQTRNPYKLDRSPSRVQLRYGGRRRGRPVCRRETGTETNGSIIDPASANCVDGVKPTVGLVGRGGVIPGVPSQDSVGTIARTVRGAAIVLGTGRDRRPRSGHRGHSDEIAPREAQATVIDPADIPTAEQLEDLPRSMIVQAYEVKRGLLTYLTSAPGDHPRCLEELIAFHRAHADSELRYVRQDGLEAVHHLDFTEHEYQQARATNHRLSRAEGVDAVLRRFRLDALVMPTTGPPAKGDLIRGDGYGGASTPTALAGHPAISVPAGFAFDLPVGLTFMGTAWSEPTLLRPRLRHEQASRVRRPPAHRSPDVGF